MGESHESKVAIRLFTWDDLPALVELVNTAGEADQSRERYTVDSLREELESASHPETDCFVTETPDGSLAGYAYVEQRQADDRLWGYGWGCVHPAYRRRGIGTQLVRAAEARFVEWARPDQPGEKAAFIQRYILDSNPGEVALALSAGFTELRASYRMSITLDQPLSPVSLPDGFALRPFAPAEHIHVVYETDQEAFLDGGGQAVRLSYDDWYQHYVDPKRYNPDLWLVAWAGDQVAGVCINQPWGEDDPGLCWVGRLGVLRPWRGRGLGSALLRQAFYVAQQQGYERAALGVRADSSTAIALYTRAGMEVYSRYAHYRKVLRGDPAVIKS